MQSSRRKPLLDELRKRAYPQTAEMLSATLGGNVSVLLSSMRWKGEICCRKFGSRRWYAAYASVFDARRYRLESRPHGVWMTDGFFFSVIGAKQMASHLAERDGCPYRVIVGEDVIREWNTTTEEQKSWLNAKRTLRQIRKHLRPPNSPTPESPLEPTSAA